MAQEEYGSRAEKREALKAKRIKAQQETMKELEGKPMDEKVEYFKKKIKEKVVGKKPKKGEIWSWERWRKDYINRSRAGEITKSNEEIQKKKWERYVTREKRAREFQKKYPRGQVDPIATKLGEIPRGKKQIIGAIPKNSPAVKSAQSKGISIERLADAWIRLHGTTPVLRYFTDAQIKIMLKEAE